MGAKELRLFIAISLPSDLQAVLAAVANPFKPVMGSTVRWVKPSHLHVTLKFLGEVDQGKISLLKPELEQIASQYTPMDLSFQSCGVFPGWKDPRVIWIGIQASQQLTSLAGTLESELRVLGFRSEERPFSPHLTLGRVNGGLTQTQKELLLAQVDSSKSTLYGTLRADHITLFRSDLQPEGPRYTDMSHANFSTLHP